MLLWEQVLCLGENHPVRQIYEYEEIPIKIRERLAVWIEVNMLETRNQQLAVVPLEQLNLPQFAEFGVEFDRQMTQEMEILRQEGQTMDRLEFGDFLVKFHEIGFPLLYEKLGRCLTHELAWVQHEPAPTFGSPNQEEISVIVNRLANSGNHLKKFTVLMHQLVQRRGSEETNAAVNNQLHRYENRSVSYASSLVANLETLVNSLVSPGGYLYNMKWSGFSIPHPDNEANLRCVGRWFSTLFSVMNVFEQNTTEFLTLCQNQFTQSDMDVLLIRIKELKFRLLEHSLQVRRQPCQVLRQTISMEFSSMIVIQHPDMETPVPNRMTVRLHMLNEEQARRWYRSRTQNTANPENSPDISTFATGHALVFKREALQPQVLDNYIHKLSIKRVHRSRRNAVLQEKMCFVLTTCFVFQERNIETWCCTNPFVCITGDNQRTMAWATIFWDHYFRVSNDMAPFLTTDTVSWHHLSWALSEYVKNTTKSTWGLTQTNLEYLYRKLWKRGLNNEAISLKNFEHQPPALSHERRPTFWEWFYFTTDLIKNHLSPIWNIGFIVGFIDRLELEDVHMQQFQSGSFALRFSEELVGGISICYVTRNDQGNKMVVSLKPFSAKDLSTRNLIEIIRDLDVLERCVWQDCNGVWREEPKSSIISLIDPPDNEPITFREGDRPYACWHFFMRVPPGNSG